LATSANLANFSWESPLASRSFLKFLVMLDITNIAEGSVGAGFRRARALEPRRPARSEQKPAKKFSFPFRRKNPSVKYHRI
jgi:hypothetical protein